MRMFRGGEGGENHLWRMIEGSTDDREYGWEMKSRNSHRPFREDERSKRGGGRGGSDPGEGRLRGDGRKVPLRPRAGREREDRPPPKFPAGAAPGPAEGGFSRRRSPPEPGGAAKADSIAEALRRRGQP